MSKQSLSNRNSLKTRGTWLWTPLTHGKENKEEIRSYPERLSSTNWEYWHCECGDWNIRSDVENNSKMLTNANQLAFTIVAQLWQLETHIDLLWFAGPTAFNVCGHKKYSDWHVLTASPHCVSAKSLPIYYIKHFYLISAILFECPNSECEIYAL